MPLGGGDLHVDHRGERAIDFFLWAARQFHGKREHLVHPGLSLVVQNRTANHMADLIVLLRLVESVNHRGHILRARGSLFEEIGPEELRLVGRRIGERLGWGLRTGWARRTRRTPLPESASSCW